MSRAPTTEKGLVALIERAVRSEYPDCWILKTVGNPYQMSGLPDLIMSVRGLFFGFEVKHRKPGESDEAARYRASPQQRMQIRKINDSGGMARVVISPEEVLALIAQGLEAHERKCNES